MKQADFDILESPRQMQFTIACHLLGEDDDLVTTVVDTKTELQEPTISFCERWLKTGDEQCDPISKRPVQLRIVERNQSGIVLGYVICGRVAAFMFAISGNNSADDQKVVRRFRDRCRSTGWVSEHAAYNVPAPGMYLLAGPARDDLSDNAATGLLQLANHVTAAFFSQVGLSV
jgi:hypothetical protein